MKRKIVVLLLVLSMIFTGLGNMDLMQTTQKVFAEKVNDNNATVGTQAKKAEEKPIYVQEKIPAYLDFSNHTDPNEFRYKTILGDINKLKNGGRVFAVDEQASQYVMKYSGTKNEGWGYDMRGCDVSKEDLTKMKPNDISFDTDTIWPEALPKGFDPDKIIEYNKNPGLGIRKLQEKGITGTNVGIAIIDQALLLDHEQYKDNLMFYEKIHNVDECSSVHGPAVASIAVGKTIGVAPGAKLYYIACSYSHWKKDGFDFDAGILADCILRVLEINKKLPKNEKIRVISISKGYGKKNKGYKELVAAIKKANKQNMFVITTTPEDYYHFNFLGLNRDYEKDPDNIHSYLPAGWVADDFYAHNNNFIKSNNIMVPMGSRTYASWAGSNDYQISHEGGMSWAVPWLAGFYALCCQVKNDITPKEFIEKIYSTGVTTNIEHAGKTYQLGKIINPAEAIKQLEHSKK